MLYNIIGNQYLIATAAGAELPRSVRRVETRMASAHPEEGYFHGPLLDPQARVVIVDVMRGGIVPSQVCFEMLTSVLPDDQVRLDHLTCSRLTDAEGQVLGAELRGSKIGGSIEDAYLIGPDPMGATGSTIVETLKYLRAHYGTPARVILLPMIATPEFLRCVLELTEDLVVYTARLDRGLSPPEVLSALPGEHWDRERGLDDKAYIVPGAGGVGEVLNNSYC